MDILAQENSGIPILQVKCENELHPFFISPQTYRLDIRVQLKTSNSERFRLKLDYEYPHEGIAQCSTLVAFHKSP